jgi:hypothetical protein
MKTLAIAVLVMLTVNASAFTVIQSSLEYAEDLWEVSVEPAPFDNPSTIEASVNI